MERLRISVNLNIPVPISRHAVRCAERRYARDDQWFERWKVEADKTFKDWYEFERKVTRSTTAILFASASAFSTC